jgi:hypothetical protein
MLNPKSFETSTSRAGQGAFIQRGCVIILLLDAKLDCMAVFLGWITMQFAGNIPRHHVFYTS